MNRWTSLALLAIALPRAGHADTMCPPTAQGVPTRFGEPPKWSGSAAWSTAPGIVDPTLDDPRWQGATGHSFTAGTAKAPLHTRALWSTVDTEYLYLSFIIDVEGIASGVAEMSRDVYIGFRRHTVVGTDQAYIFQFHLKEGGPSALPLAYCATHGDCDETIPGTRKDYWRVYVDRGAQITSGLCGTSSAQPGRRFDRLEHATNPALPPVDWVADKDVVRYFKPSGNRWAVQIRFPLVANGSAISQGIEHDAAFWYQATAGVSTDSNYAVLGVWPKNGSGPTCYESASDGILINKSLMTAAGYGAVKFPNDATAETCDAGISIDTQSIGSLPDYTGTNLAGETPTVGIKAFRSDGVTPVVNTIFAQPKNNAAATFNKPLSARFRLAAWGAAGLSGDPGEWLDIRGTVPTVAGQQPGICNGQPGDPNANDACTTIAPISSSQKGAISFTWRLGNDPVQGNSEYCKYQLAPPTGWSCEPCTCVSPPCDPGDAGSMGTRAKQGTTTHACVSANYFHQCLLVELSAPNGDVTFERQSAWNNMTFSKMSTSRREALIDARNLPKAPGQRFQDIYLVGMPRNMPETLPGGTNGADFVRRQAFERAKILAKPYEDDFRPLAVARVKEIAAQLGNPMPRPPGTDDVQHDDVQPRRPRRELHNTRARLDAARKLGPDFEQVRQARVIMPPDQHDKIGRLLDIATSEGTPADVLTEATVAAVGGEEAADVVPTLEIYAYYRPNDAGRAYLPMTGFSVFLSHEGAMSGIKWLIDGADRVGENVYHLRIPVEMAKRIQVRSQALEPSDIPLNRNNPRWPCAAGCACGGTGGAANANRSCGLISILGNTAPVAVAGVFAMRRRRKKPAPR